MIRICFYLQVILLLIVLPFCTRAQDWGTPLIITFDADDTVYQHAVFIDTDSHVHNSWQIGRPDKAIFDSAHSWQNAIVTDTLHPYAVNDTSIFVLSLRNFLNTSYWWHAVNAVTFFYQMDVDTGSKGIVEYSADIGHTWHVASLAESHYPDTTTFTHASTGWQCYTIYFNQISDSLLLRFTFISDSDTSTHDGWIIDDINVNYWTEGVSTLTRPGTYFIYPNPAKTKLMISTASMVGTVVIYNISGQIVHRKNYNDSSAQIDVSQLPRGMYLIHVDGVVAGNFVKD